MLSKEVAYTFFERLRSDNPEPETELNYGSPFELLVAVILSAQATDIGVNRATAKLFSAANTPEAFLLLGEEGLKRYIASIGLYHSKAKHIMATCHILVQKHQSRVPGSREELEALPGVGRKTANVLLNILFGEATIAVDTHIFRIGNRTGLAPGKTPLAVEKNLMKVVPKPFLSHAHHWLILHGRYVCKARSPQCLSCPVADLCLWPDKPFI